MLPGRFGPDAQRGVGEPFAARGSACCTEYGRLLHAKTVHVGTSSPRELVDYRAAPSGSAPTRVFCGNSAMDSARVPPRLVEGEMTPNLLNSCIFYAFQFYHATLWCQPQRPGRSNRNSASPQRSWSSPRISQQACWAAGRWCGHGFCSLDYFVIEAVESRSRCRRLMRNCL